MSEYTRHLELGWGVAATVFRGVERDARLCGVKLEPLPFLKLQPVNLVTVRAEGDDARIKAFEACMQKRLRETP